MMTPQGLQIASSEDSLARLGIVTNGVVMVNIMFRVCVADCRRVPVRIQGCTYLFVFHGHRLLQLLFGSHIHLPYTIKPGALVFTTSLSLCLV
jgi:hypothetical protein